MSFLLPAGLFALLALALPLLIHLIRRPPTETVRFAALRWLGSVARPQRQWRLRQWLLLLLRLLLLAALALLLAEPVRVAHDDTNAVRAVATVLPAPAPQADLRDVWLAPGFPAITPDMPTPAPDQPISSLLRQLDAQLPTGTALQVMVAPMLDGTDGQSLQLSRAVDWQVLPLGDAPSPSEADPATPPQLVLRHDSQPDTVASLRYWQAIASAWQPEHEADIAADDTPLPALDAQHLLVWLSQAPLPEGAAQAGALIVAGSSDDSASTLLDNGQGQALLQRSHQRSALVLTQPLSADHAPVLRDAGFPARLLAALQPPLMPQRADAVDHRPGTGAAARHMAPTPQPLAPPLIVLIAVLFLLERLLASWPRREAA